MYSGEMLYVSNRLVFSPTCSWKALGTAILGVLATPPGFSIMYTAQLSRHTRSGQFMWLERSQRGPWGFRGVPQSLQGPWGWVLGIPTLSLGGPRGVLEGSRWILQADSLCILLKQCTFSTSYFSASGVLGTPLGSNPALSCTLSKWCMFSIR